jgi:peptidoglycan hydrolase-like protein with peptidoglycan-binding domain
MKVRFLPIAFSLASFVALGAQAQPTMPPQLTYMEALSPHGVALVQRQLRNVGDYGGSVDGVWGPGSVVALQKFQQIHGLQVTGELNQATVATLGLDPDTLLGVSQITASAPEQPATLSRHAVIAVQEKLENLGFYQGPADGVWGPETQAAIAQFQHSRGLEPNSQLNPATITGLGLSPDVFAER